MNTILVTGGAGFIGSHCIDRLLARGDRVICVDSFNDFYDPKVKRKNIKLHKKNPNFVLVKADIANRKAMESVFSHKIDKILHLAARAGVRPSLDDPVEYVRSNVLGTSIIFELARKHNIKRIVFASSSSVYGGNTKVPFSESDRVDSPWSPYAATKRSCEIIASNYHHIANMHVCALRFFTVYGPRNRPDMAMFKFAKSISSGEPITLFGDESVRRDWTFVDDIVDGTLACLDNVEKCGFEIVNIGNSNPVSPALVISLLESELGKKAIINRAPLPLGDVVQTFADTSKMEKLFGWKPSTSIESGVKKFVEWFKSN